MKDLTELSLAGTRLWFDAWTAQANAATTIALRLPIVMGDPQGDEAWGMVTEKVVATTQGTLAAMAATGDMIMAALAGAGPLASARAAVAIAKAASDPANTQVGLNARRLLRQD